MNLPPNAARAAQILRRAARKPRRPDMDQRARGIATITRAQAARQRRARLSAVAAGALAVAALGLLWIRVAPEQTHEPAPDAGRTGVRAVSFSAGARVVDTNGEHQLTTTSPVMRGSRVMVDRAGQAQLDLSSGSSLDLDGGASMTVKSVDSTRRFQLHSGSLLAKVAKLHSGERFIVDTADATVEVRGTQFKLSFVEADGCQHESRTRLIVSEGLVTVTTPKGSSVQVGAGQRWPAVCWENPERSAVDKAPPSEPRGVDVEAVTRPPARTAKASEHEGSSLGKQNDLFAAAVQARVAGNSERAARLYQEFETTYPESPLAQNACVERMRLLSRSNPSLARKEARRYLKKYSGGFAQHEARRIGRGP